MAQLSIEELNEKALSIRRSIITMLHEAGSGHSAGPLGLTDAYTALYFKVLKHHPQHPEWPDRDRVIVSNGHTCPVLYATLAESGYFAKQELSTLRKLNSRLQGHPHRNISIGIENTAGPLGQGLSTASGIALSFRRDQLPQQVYCFMGDGEQQEGQNWEAYMFAAKYSLGNLTVLIDRNHIQIDGFTEEVMPINSLKDKLESFNWHVQEIDGHNIAGIVAALEHAQSIFHQPSVIILNTIPGKGVDFMENKVEWHGKPPNDVDAIEALKNLKSVDEYE